MMTHIVPRPFSQASIIAPQKWNRGKVLYVIIRYGTIVYIALHLSSEWNRLHHFRSLVDAHLNVCTSQGTTEITIQLTRW